MSRDDVHPDVTGIDELVATFGADLHAARDATPMPTVGDELARIFADGLPPVATPGTARRRTRRVGRRVAVGATVLGFGLGGLGVAGALPAPVQRAVHDVADVVGVHVPDHVDAPAPAVPSTTTTPSTAPPAAETTTTHVPPVVPPSTVPARGDDRGRSDDEHGRPDDVPGDVHADDRSGTPDTTVPAVADEHASRGRGNDDAHATTTTTTPAAEREHGRGRDADVTEVERDDDLEDLAQRP